MIPTVDPIKLAQVAAAAIGLLYSSWALRRALRNFRDVHNTTEEELMELQPAAVRRVRQQAFLLATQGVLLTAGVITMVPITTTAQVMSVRGFSMAVVSILLLLKSALDHWEQRSIDRQPWDGQERRRA